jgi:diguanylate cyclase (GGDEF)-like protein
MLVAALMFPFSAGHWVIDEWILLHPQVAPYYDFTFLAGFQKILAAFVLAWVGIMGVGILVRHKDLRGTRVEGALVWLTIQLYSVGNSVGAVCGGTVTTPHIIVLVGGVGVGLFLFDARVVVLGMTSASLVIVVAGIATFAEWIPYAPLLASPPYVAGHVSGWWVGEMTAVGAAASLALVVLFGYLTARLRDRERRLEAMARTDALTGVANRRRFLEVFTREFERAKRYGTSLSCVLLDLDHFKSINDRHGHQVGDRVLVAAAQAFTRSLRTHDTIARWGGEEFVLLLPQTDLAGAEAVAERCRRSLEDTVIPAEGGRVAATVSIGVATHPQPPFESEGALLKSADDALYRAKVSGRNRVATIPPPA